MSVHTYVHFFQHEVYPRAQSFFFLLSETAGLAGSDHSTPLACEREHSMRPIMDPSQSIRPIILGQFWAELADFRVYSITVSPFWAESICFA